jgi:hypothetical protein
MIPKPRRRFTDERGDRAVMGVNILTRDVGDKSLIPEGLTIQNERRFLSEGARTELGGTKELAKLKRHVEAGQIGSRVQFRLRNVVNTEGAFFDDAADLVVADFTRVIALARATWGKTRPNYCED